MQDKIGYISSLAPCPGVIPTQFNAGSFWNKSILEDFEIKVKRQSRFICHLW